MMTVESMIAQRTQSSPLGPQSEKVAQVLVRMPQFASYASAREVAERAGANVSTVVRTAQQLGFKGWTDLREGIRTEYFDSLVASETKRPASNNVAAAMFRQDSMNLSATSTKDNIASIRNVASSIRQARRTVVLATGSGAGPAQILSYLASIYGYDVQVAAGPATSQAVTISQLNDQDTLVVLNVWRLTAALRGLTTLGKRQGATVAVLTDLHSSPLNADADHVVITPIEGVNATPSLTAMVATIHAILAVLEGSATKPTVGRIERAWQELGLMDEQP